MATTIPKGHFVWYDLMTPDPVAAVPFYTKLLGWGTEVWKGPMPYTMWTVEGKALGGTMRLPPEAIKAGAHPHWLAYITTPDVDATAKQATSLGARALMPPMDIPDVGRFVTIADPDGALFAAYTPEMTPPTLGQAPAMGHVAWNELIARDNRKGLAFYQALFGWELVREHDIGPMGKYLIYGLGGQEFGGMFANPAGGGMPPHWMHYIRTLDVDQAAVRAKELGGKVLHGPMDVPGGGRVVNCSDPQGAVFALMSQAKS